MIASTSPLHDLMATHARGGRIAWIGLRPERRAAVQSVGSAEATLAGLAGDHGAGPGKRAITLIQAEHLPVIGAFLGEGPVAPERLRRNVVVEGLNLLALRGATFRLGTAVLRGTGPCAPCSRMTEELGSGGYNAVRGHGGITAEVLEPGQIHVGDARKRNGARVRVSALPNINRTSNNTANDADPLAVSPTQSEAATPSERYTVPVTPQRATKKVRRDRALRRAAAKKKRKRYRRAYRGRSLQSLFMHPLGRR